MTARLPEEHPQPQERAASRIPPPDYLFFFSREEGIGGKNKEKGEKETGKKRSQKKREEGKKTREKVWRKKSSPTWRVSPCSFSPVPSSLLLVRRGLRNARFFASSFPSPPHLPPSRRPHQQHRGENSQRLRGLGGADFLALVWRSCGVWFGLGGVRFFQNGDGLFAGKLSLIFPFLFLARSFLNELCFSD